MTEKRTAPGKNVERCERCNRQLSNHAEVTVRSSGVVWICPTTDGHAVSDEVSLQ